LCLHPRQLFFAPIVPAGSNYMTMPGPRQRFGRWFGSLPKLDLFRLHEEFKSYIGTVAPRTHVRLMHAAGGRR